jgi:hypothetical protein
MPQPQPSSLPQIPLPTSLTSTTPRLPTETQALLIQHLRAQNALPDLHDLLTDTLARSGWTDRVRALGTELLRNGTCDTFPQLLTEVLRRAKLPKSDIPQTQTQTGDGGNVNVNVNVNGTSTPTGSQANGANGAGAIAVAREWTGGPDGLPDVHVPVAAIEAAVEFVEEKIKGVSEPVDEDDDD